MLLYSMVLVTGVLTLYGCLCTYCQKSRRWDNIVTSVGSLDRPIPHTYSAQSQKRESGITRIRERDVSEREFQDGPNGTPSLLKARIKSLAFMLRSVEE